MTINEFCPTKRSFNIFYSYNLEICRNNEEERKKFEGHFNSTIKKYLNFYIFLNNLMSKNMTINKKNKR